MRAKADADQWHAFAAPQATFFAVALLRGAVLFGTIAACTPGGIGAAQTGAKIMRIGDAIEDRMGDRVLRSDPADVFLILPASVSYASDNTLMHGTVAFPRRDMLAVCRWDNHASDSWGVNQWQQTLYLHGLKIKHFLKTRARPAGACTAWMP
ncbi:hypothetical protein KCP73_09620 [Salmonella enterica subsp. enterica]|nr:hypothetical protein KCP73_09620 [Salmonella enterica subsp. enterica]